MKNGLVRFFPMLMGIMLFIACNNKSGNNTNIPPAYQRPELKDITEKIIKDTANAGLYFQRGNILHRLEDDSLALKDYKKAASLDSSKAEYFSAVGNLLFDHKDISGSIPWLQKAIALNPTDPRAHLKIAKMFMYLQQYDKAFQEINVVLRKDVYNPEPYFLKGMIYKNMGDTTKALSSFLTAVQVAPDYRDAIIQLGQIYSSKQNPVALQYYDNAFKLDTTDVFPLFARGVYYQDQQKYEQAKAEYKNCIEHDNQFADAYLNTGWILLQQDSVEKAWRQYDLVTKIEPNSAAAYYSRGLCSEMMHKKQDAINDYKQALVFNSKYQDAREGLKRLGAK